MTNRDVAAARFRAMRARAARARALVGRASCRVGTPIGVLVLAIAGVVAPANAQVTLTTATDVVTPGDAVTVTIAGPAGQHYALLGSSVGAGLVHAGVSLAVGTEFAIIASGVIGATGQVTVSGTPPFLFTTLDRYYLQAVASPSPAFATIQASAGLVLRNAHLVGNLFGPPGPLGSAGATRPRGTSRTARPAGAARHPGPVRNEHGHRTGGQRPHLLPRRDHPHRGQGRPGPSRQRPAAVHQPNTALFSLLEFRFGGDGQTTFGLPDLRAAAPNGLTYTIRDQGVFPSTP